LVLPTNLPDHTTGDTAHFTATIEDQYGNPTTSSSAVDVELIQVVNSSQTQVGTFASDSISGSSASFSVPLNAAGEYVRKR